MIATITRDEVLSKIVDVIIPDIIGAIGDNLLSVFLVGSMAKQDYIFRENNDLDLRFMLSDVTEQAYARITAIMESATKKIRTPKLNVLTSDVIGPVRYSAQKEMSLFLHYIVLNEDVFNALPKLHKFSYSQSYMLLFGENVVYSLEEIKYTAEDICYNTEGIFYCVGMLRQRKLKYQRWVPVKGIMVLNNFEEEMDDTTFIETLRYTLLKSIYNCRTWLKWIGRNLDNSDVRGVFHSLSICVDEDTYVGMLKLMRREYDDGEFAKQDVANNFIDVLTNMANSVLCLEKAIN